MSRIWVKVYYAYTSLEVDLDQFSFETIQSVIDKIVTPDH